MSTAEAQRWSEPRRLPAIHLDGEGYFVDIRLREFRTKTPPIRCIEFIGFDSEKGRRMLKGCLLFECERCGQATVLSRHSTKSSIECGRCRGRI